MKALPSNFPGSTTPKYFSCSYNYFHSTTISCLNDFCNLLTPFHFPLLLPTVYSQQSSWLILFYHGLWNNSTPALQIFSIFLRVKAITLTESFKDLSDLSFCYVCWWCCLLPAPFLSLSPVVEFSRIPHILQVAADSKSLLGCCLFIQTAARFAPRFPQLFLVSQLMSSWLLLSSQSSFSCCIYPKPFVTF